MTAPWHPSGARLSAFLDGEASSWDRARVLAHLEHCAACAQTLEFEQRTKVSLSTLRLTALPTSRELQASLVAVSAVPKTPAGRHAGGRHAAAQIAARHVAGGPRHVVRPTVATPTRPATGPMHRPVARPILRSVRPGTRLSTVGAVSVAGLCLAFVSVLPGTAAADTRASAGSAARLLTGQTIGAGAAGAAGQLLTITGRLDLAGPTAVAAVCLQLKALASADGPAHPVAGGAASSAGGWGTGLPTTDPLVVASVTATPGGSGLPTPVAAPVSQSPTALADPAATTPAGPEPSATAQPEATPEPSDDPVPTSSAPQPSTAPLPSTLPTDPEPTSPPAPTLLPTGGPGPAPTSAPAPTATPTATGAPAPTGSPAPTGTPEPTGTLPPTGTPAPTPSGSGPVSSPGGSATPAPTAGPTTVSPPGAQPSASVDPSVTSSPTASVAPTGPTFPTPTLSASASPDPSADPSATADPGGSPTSTPTGGGDQTITPTPPAPPSGQAPHRVGAAASRGVPADDTTSRPLAKLTNRPIPAR